MLRILFHGLMVLLTMVLTQLNLRWLGLTYPFQLICGILTVRFSDASVSVIPF